MSGTGMAASAVALTALFAITAPTASAEPFVGAPGLGDPYYPLDGNGGYDVGHYDVTIDYDPPSRELFGRTRVEAVATEALRRFDLDYAGPAIRGVTVNGLPAAFDRNGEHELTVTPALPLLPALPFQVVVEYAGTMTDNPGEGWTVTDSGGAFVAGEPHAATSWYPLNDTPLDKATFTLHATVPTDWDVVSNGLRTGRSVSGDRHTLTWESRHPVLGYLTTVAIDRFTYLEQVRADGTPLLSAFAPGARDNRSVEEQLPRVLDFTEELYGPYPFDTAGGIYVDDDISFSLETQTRPIYAPWTDLQTVVHEIAHQWWGNSMSVRQWSDICLNECFASYTADYLWPERIDGVDVDALYRATIAEYREDPGFWEIPLANPGAGNEFTSVYYRGPLFLHALRARMGDPAFFGTLRDFVGKHAYGNASMADFRAFAQSRTTTDLTGFLHAWLDTEQIPAPDYLFPGSLSD